MGKVKQAMIKDWEDQNQSHLLVAAGVDINYTPVDALPEGAAFEYGMGMLHDEEDRGTSPRLSDE